VITVRGGQSQCRIMRAFAHTRRGAAINTSS
jgi:hypothetical protein